MKNINDFNDKEIVAISEEKRLINESKSLAFIAIKNWIKEVTGINFLYPNDFRKSVSDGVILCNLLNCLKPGAITRINKNSTAIAGFENIGNFLRSCKEEFGLNPLMLFRTTDLEDLTNKSSDVVGDTEERLKRVLLCLFHLAKSVENNLTKAMLDSSPFDIMLKSQDMKPVGKVRSNSSTDEYIYDSTGTDFIQQQNPHYLADQALKTLSQTKMNQENLAKSMENDDWQESLENWREKRRQALSQSTLDVFNQDSYNDFEKDLNKLKEKARKMKQLRDQIKDQYIQPSDDKSPVGTTSAVIPDIDDETKAMIEKIKQKKFAREQMLHFSLSSPSIASFSSDYNESSKSLPLTKRKEKTEDININDPIIQESRHDQTDISKQSSLSSYNRLRKAVGPTSEKNDKVFPGSQDDIMYRGGQFQSINIIDTRKKRDENIHKVENKKYNQSVIAGEGIDSLEKDLTSLEKRKNDIVKETNKNVYYRQKVCEEVLKLFNSEEGSSQSKIDKIDSKDSNIFDNHVIEREKENGKENKLTIQEKIAKFESKGLFNPAFLNQTLPKTSQSESSTVLKHPQKLNYSRLFSSPVLSNNKESLISHSNLSTPIYQAEDIQTEKSLFSTNENKFSKPFPLVNEASFSNRNITKKESNEEETDFSDRKSITSTSRKYSPSSPNSFKVRNDVDINKGQDIHRKLEVPSVQSQLLFPIRNKTLFSRSQDEIRSKHKSHDSIFLERVLDNKEYGINSEHLEPNNLEEMKMSPIKKLDKKSLTIASFSPKEQLSKNEKSDKNITELQECVNQQYESGDSDNFDSDINSKSSISSGPSLSKSKNERKSDHFDNASLLSTRNASNLFPVSTSKTSKKNDSKTIDNSKCPSTLTKEMKKLESDKRDWNKSNLNSVEKSNHKLLNNEKSTLQSANSQTVIFNSVTNKTQFRLSSNHCSSENSSKVYSSSPSKEIKKEKTKASPKDINKEYDSNFQSSEDIKSATCSKCKSQLNDPRSYGDTETTKSGVCCSNCGTRKNSQSKLRNPFINRQHQSIMSNSFSKETEI